MKTSLRERIRLPAILTVLLLSLVPLAALEAEAAPTTPFLLGTTYGDGFAIEHYSDYTKKLITPVNTFHNGQRWVPANHTVVASGDPDYDFHVIEGKYQAFFRTDLTSGAESGLDEDRYAVKFLLGNDWVVNRPDALFYRGATGPPEQVAGVNNSIGSPVNATFVYPEVFVGQDITLRYVYNRELLKEEFVLQGAPPAPTDPTDDLHLDLLFFYPEYVQIRADGTLWDRNSRVTATNITFENATTSQALFAMANPFAVDADGAGLNLVYELDRDPPNLKVRMRIDSSWLQDADRVYPVILDPTLTIQPSEKDARVDELDPTTNKGTETVVRVQSFECGACDPALQAQDERTFVQWDVSSIPAGVTITGANASLYMTSAPSASRTYQAREADASWSETAITWDNQPTMEGADADSVASGTTSNVWLTWDVTPEVQAWYDGTDTNYGLRIMDSSEGSATSRTGTFNSRESANTEKPRLVVDYTEPPAVTDPAWVDLTFFNSLNADGLPFFKFQVIISSDNDSALLERATFNPYPWNVSDTVSVEVKDFNDNVLATQSAVELGGANSHTGISIGVGIAEVTPLFSDGRQHIWRYCPTTCTSFEDNSTTVFGSALLATSLAYTFDVPEDEYIFGVAEASLIPLNEAAHTVPVGVAPKDLDELYLNQTRDMYVASFDGAGDRLEISHTDVFEVGTSFTISVWVRVDSAETGAGGVFDSGGRQEATDEGFNLHRASSAIWRLQFMNVGGGASALDSQTTAYTDVWTYVTGTYDGATMSIYINGTLDNSVAETDTVETHSTSTHYVGALSDVSHYIDAEIANVQVYNNSLSAAQVSELWARGMQGHPIEGEALLLHLPLAELWSDLAHDYTGNDFHGTLIGDATFLEVVSPLRSTVFFTFFDAALGEPHDLQDWVLWWGEERVANRVSTGFVGTTNNYTVKSGFGSDLATGSATVDDYPADFVDILLTSYGFTVFNQRESCTLTQLTLDSTGIGRTRFINQWQEFTWWIPGGAFTLNVTFYSDSLCSTIDSYVEAAFTISAANNFILTSVNTLARTIAAIDENDAKIEVMWDDLNSTWAAVNATHDNLLLSWSTLNTTESNVRFVWNVGNNTWSSVNASTGQVLGIYDRTNATWILVNQLDVPAGVAIAYDTYYVPPTNMIDLLSKDLAPGLAIDPFRTVIYDVVNTSEGTGRLLLHKPYEVGWDDDDVTLMQDDLHVALVSGSLTRMWVNDTQDTDATGDDTIVLNVTYAGYFDLTQFGDGLNLSVETEGTASVNLTRVSQVRYVSTFLWTQDTVTRQWTMTTNLENTLDLPWSNVNVYVAFPQTIDPDPSTVVVRDVTASVDLEKGIHYDLTDGGVYLALATHVSDASTTWRVTYFERVVGTAITEPRCSFGQVTVARRGITDMARVGVACVNENPFDYRGRLVLVFDLGREVDHADVIIEDTSGNRLPNTMYWNDRNTLIVVGASVDSLSTLQLVVWFRYVSDALAPADLLPYLPHLTLVFAAAAGIVFWAWGRQPKRTVQRDRAKMLFILFAILAVIAFVLLVYLQIVTGL